MQLTEQQRAVLALVAADVGVPADQFWIDERGAVFFMAMRACAAPALLEHPIGSSWAPGRKPPPFFLALASILAAKGVDERAEFS